MSFRDRDSQQFSKKNVGHFLFKNFAIIGRVNGTILLTHNGIDQGTITVVIESEEYESTHEILYRISQRRHLT